MADRIRTFLVTGATSGVGLAAMAPLLADPRHRAIVGARQPEAATALKAVGGDRVEILSLDLTRQASVAAFASAVAARAEAEGPIHGVACNAGVQIVGALRNVEGGVEETFAANHLGHFALVNRLLGHLAPGATVVSTASGTHDPNDRLARLFGFRGAAFPSADRVAVGDLGREGSVTQKGLDRYATSKLCTILFTMEMARRIPPAQARFLALDPGLMPGTGLARDRSGMERFGWTYLLPALRFVVAGVSTPQRSGATLAGLLTGALAPTATGGHFDHDGRVSQPSAAALDPALAADLHAASVRLTGVGA